MNILLIVIAAILVLSLVGGYTNGFLKTAFSLISWILVLVVCYIATPLVSEVLIEKTPIETNVQNMLDAKIDEILANAMAEIGVSDFSRISIKSALPIP